MAPTQGTPSFDDIIQAGRQRKKDQLRAQQLLGGRRSSTPQLANKPKFGSLASRISKPSQRSSSSSAVTRAKFQARGDEFRTKIQLPSRFGNGQAHSATSGGFTIRGLAGPYVVVGSNFATGTSSDDIRSAVESVVGEFLSCRVITASPTVIAEMVFADKDSADAVIAKFNNQKADGRLIHLYLKNGPPTAPIPAKTAPKIAPQSNVLSSPTLASGIASQRRAEPEIQDGRYGFGGGRDEPIDVDMEDGRDRSQVVLDTDRAPHPRRDDRRFDDRRDDRRGYGGRDYQRDRQDDYRGDRRGGYEARRLYSDDLYSPQQRGRSFR